MMLLSRRQFIIGTLGTAALGITVPKQSAKIRVAIVGLGQQGMRHLEALRDIQAVEIVGLCDVSTAALHRAGQLVPDARQTQDFRAFLTWGTVDAVVIATPNSSAISKDMLR